MLTVLLVLAGGAAGATGRFLVDQAITRRRPGPLPWGTLTVNLAGSLLLGFVAGAGAAFPGWVGAVVGTGFCGAFTTYSTFGFETVRLASGARPDGRLLAALNVAVTLVVGITAAAVGWSIANRLFAAS